MHKDPAPAESATATPVPSAEGATTPSLKAFHSSQTFVARMPHPDVIRLRIVTIVTLLAVFFVGIPALNASGFIPDYKVNILSKYLCFTLAGLGIDLIWGYTGLLSLCQALFFCIGGYVMAMHLSLPQGGGDVRPEYNNIPQFMFFNNVRSLPGFWQPFASMPMTTLAGFLLPALAASVFGFIILRSRVRGVYFSIITQALAWAGFLLISRNEMLLGGTNGLTNFYKPMMQARSWIVGLYLVTLTVVVLAYLLCRAIVRSRLGRVLIAVRDKETRLYFAGYKPYVYKVFAFAVAALLAGVGGMLYSPQVGIITPQNMSVEESILLVVCVAVGGRGRLWGSIFGILAVYVTRSSLSSDLPSVWLFALGGISVAVVLFFPEGIAGLWAKMENQIATGAGYGRAAITALPVVVIGLFVLSESLGLTPRFLAEPKYGPLGVPLKYGLIIGILIAVSVFNVVEARQARGVLSRRGFPVAAAGGAV